MFAAAGPAREGMAAHGPTGMDVTLRVQRHVARDHLTHETGRASMRGQLGAAKTRPCWDQLRQINDMMKSQVEHHPELSGMFAPPTKFGARPGRGGKPAKPAVQP